MLLGFIPLFPFLTFFVLLIFGSGMKRSVVSILGVLGIASSFGVSLLCALQYVEPVSYIAWTWIPSDSGFFDPIQFGFYLDPLSIVMTAMVTFVATLIAVFSIQFMDEEEDIVRFFSCINLFVFSMLILVLADNLLLLMLGWEGVGLCSYLLIGFWYQDSKNGKAARKAFLITRIGDIGLLIATLILATTVGTLVIQDVPPMAIAAWEGNTVLPTVVALCLLFAATGKSAQLPLQTWLPDAMVGPTPVSALIHAATMVTAGVYLIARLNGLYSLSWVAQMAVLVVGAATLLLAGLCALFQSDLKRVLAYSTMSQIGYMFLALGSGAYSAAMFHLVTHAFFKALLFLSAGVIGYCAHHEYNMFKLGGLRKSLPVAYYSFLVGALCLSALPIVTSGFYSKEFILSGVLFSATGGQFAWICGIVGAFLTGLYTFRAVVLTFFGREKTKISHQPGLLMIVPLFILAIFSILLGFMQTPEHLFDMHLFDDWVRDLFPTSILSHHSFLPEMSALIVASLVSIAGILGGIFSYQRAVSRNNLITRGFGFDELYTFIFVAPYSFLSRVLRRDFFGAAAQTIANCVVGISLMLSRIQTGRLSDYAGFLAFSLSLIIVVAVLVLR